MQRKGNSLDKENFDASAMIQRFIFFISDSEKKGLGVNCLIRFRKDALIECKITFLCGQRNKNLIDDIKLKHYSMIFKKLIGDININFFSDITAKTIFDD